MFLIHRNLVAEDHPADNASDDDQDEEQRDEFGEVAASAIRTERGDRRVGRVRDRGHERETDDDNDERRQEPPDGDLTSLVLLELLIGLGHERFCHPIIITSSHL